MMYKNSSVKTNVHTIFCSEWLLGFVIDYAWNSKLLCDAPFTWRLSWLKSDLIQDLFRGIWVSNSSCIGKSIILLFLSSWRDKFALLQQNSVTDVFVGFRPPYWCLPGWAPTWRLHTNLYKFEGKTSPPILHKKNCCDLNLGESLCIVAFFLWSDSELNL